VQQQIYRRVAREMSSERNRLTGSAIEARRGGIRRKESARAIVDCGDTEAKADLQGDRGGAVLLGGNCEDAKLKDRGQSN